LKLEKEEENEMEKRRKVVSCPVSPMSETLVEVNQAIKAWSF